MKPLEIPPMPELPVSLHKPGDHLYGNVNRLREWGQECAAIAQQQADRVEELEQIIAALEPGEENPLTVARRLKRERVELGLAINRLAQALGWPSVTPDQPFGEQIVDAALGRIAGSKALADELAEALWDLRPFSNDAFDWAINGAEMALAKHTAARQMNKEARNG